MSDLFWLGAVPIVVGVFLLVWGILNQRRKREDGVVESFRGVPERRRRGRRLVAQDGGYLDDDAHTSVVESTHDPLPVETDHIRALRQARTIPTRFLARLNIESEISAETSILKRLRDRFVAHTDTSRAAREAILEKARLDRVSDEVARERKRDRIADVELDADLAAASRRAHRAQSSRPKRSFDEMKSRVRRDLNRKQNIDRRQALNEVEAEKLAAIEARADLSETQKSKEKRDLRDACNQYRRSQGWV